MSIKVVTLGCRLNIYESEIIKENAKKAKLENVIIINSCAVTSEAEKKLKKSIKSLKKKYMSSSIILTGCAAQLSPEIYKKYTEIDWIIGNKEKLELDIYEKIANQRNLGTHRSPYAQQNLGENFNDKECDKREIEINQNHINYNSISRKMRDAVPQTNIIVSDINELTESVPAIMLDSFENNTRAFIQVQNGCNHSCTFCTIPMARGKNRSVPLGAIVEQIKRLCKSGYKEFVITGVDITDYGKDLSYPITLGKAIKRIIECVPEIIRLRLSSIDVAEIDDELFSVITEEKKIMPYFHLSLQSGCDLILKRMKRRHLKKDILKFCTEVRERRNDIVFGADIIAGFPTETDEDFWETYNLLKELFIPHLHIFTYSIRSGTPAAKMPQINERIKKERSKSLIELGEMMLSEHYKCQIGDIVEVLCENGEGDGRTEKFSTAKLINEKESIGNSRELFVPGEIYTGKVVDSTIVNGKYILSVQQILSMAGEIS